MKLILEKASLTNREKQIYADAIDEAEDIDDLKDIVNGIFFHDKKLFAQINKFPKDASFEDIKANILKNLVSEEDNKVKTDEAYYPNKYNVALEKKFDSYGLEYRKISPNSYCFSNFGDAEFGEALAYEAGYDASYLDENELIVASFKQLEESIRLSEDTIKTKDGKWTNKGDEGTHGKFRTKKQADAQRKAMFANGYHESLNEEVGSEPVNIS